MAAATSYTPGLGSATPLGLVSRLTTTATDGSYMARGYSYGWTSPRYRVSILLYLTPAPVSAGHNCGDLSLASPAFKVAGASAIHFETNFTVLSAGW